MSPLIPSVYQHVDTSGTITVCYSFEIGCTNWAGEGGRFKDCMCSKIKSMKVNHTSHMCHDRHIPTHVYIMANNDVQLYCNSS